MIHSKTTYKTNLAFVCIALIVNLLSCSKDQDSNTLKLAITDKIPNFDPVHAYDSISLNILGNVYETLYQYNYIKRPYQVEPLLAEDMPVLSDDFKIYTIKIRKSIPYHKEPKRLVTAKDIVHQIKRIAYLGNNSHGWWLFDGKIQGINEFRKRVGTNIEKLYTEEITGIEVIDDHTLKFHLTAPYPQFIYALTMTFTTPIPSEVCQRYSNDFSKITYGTGPYLVEKYDTNTKMILRRFSDYRDPIHIEKVQYQIMEQSQTRWLNFLSSKIHATTLGKDQVSLAINDEGNLREELIQKGLHLQTVDSMTFWWLSFNMNHPVVGNSKKIRKAIAMAVERDKLVHIFTQGTGKLANSIYPPAIIGHDPTYNLSFDPKRAKAILNSLGYDEDNPLVINFDLRGNDTTSRQFGEFMQASMEKIGVKLKIHLNRFSVFLEKARKGELEMWLDGWTLDYPHPENILQLLISSNHPPGANATYYENQEIDNIHKNITSNNDSHQFLPILKRAQDIVFQDVVWIPLYYSTIHTLTHNNLSNYHASDLINNKLKYLKLKTP